MNDFRKKLHLEYKKKMVDILLWYMGDMMEILPKYSKDPEKHTIDWVNANCLPTGDFDKEQAIKEIEEWSEP